MKGYGMNLVKDDMIDLIRKQPEDSSYDEILRELAMKKMIDRGLSDVRNSRTISNEEVKRRINSWQK